MARKLVMRIERKDFKITTYRGSGPGGQHRNKTDTGVRIQHIETGLMVECCETRSQHQNKMLAFNRIAKLVAAHYFPEHQKARAASGTEIIRTYHAVDNRVKDVASGLQQPYQEVLDDPTQMVEARKAAMEQNQ